MPHLSHRHAEHAIRYTLTGSGGRLGIRTRELGGRYVREDGSGRDAEVNAAVAAAKQAARERVMARCGDCGYLLTRCCCPGGPRGPKGEETK
jgi:hypothetical protein